MTSMKAIIAKAINTLEGVSDEIAISTYRTVRSELAILRNQKAPNCANVAALMVAMGNHIEARIGEDRFDALMTETDHAIYG